MLALLQAAAKVLRQSPDNPSQSHAHRVQRILASVDPSTRTSASQRILELFPDLDPDTLQVLLRVPERPDRRQWGPADLMNIFDALAPLSGSPEVDVVRTLLQSTRQPFDIERGLPALTWAQRYALGATAEFLSSLDTGSAAGIVTGQLVEIFEITVDAAQERLRSLPGKDAAAFLLFWAANAPSVPSPAEGEG